MVTFRSSDIIASTSFLMKALLRISSIDGFLLLDIVYLYSNPHFADVHLLSAEL